MALFSMFGHLWVDYNKYVQNFPDYSTRLFVGHLKFVLSQTPDLFRALS